MSVTEIISLLSFIVMCQALTVTLVIHLHSKYNNTQIKELNEIKLNAKRFEIAKSLAIDLGLTLRTSTEINTSLCQKMVAKTCLDSQLPGLKQELLKQRHEMSRVISELMLFSHDTKERTSAIQHLTNQFKDYKCINLLRKMESFLTGSERESLKATITKLDKELKMTL